eukprot:403344561
MDKRQKKHEQKQLKKESKNNSTSSTEVQNQSQDQEEEVKVPLPIPEQAQTQQTHLKRPFSEMSKYQTTPPCNIDMHQIGVVTNSDGVEQSMSKFIFSRYKVFERLGPAQGPQKQVYLVQDIYDNYRTLVLKLFMFNESSLFNHEFGNNVDIIECITNYQVTKIRHEAYSDSMPDFYLDGSLFKKYALLVFPYHKNQTVLDFIKKSIECKVTLSDELKAYLCYGVAKATHELHTICGKAHMDIKLDNYVFDENFNIMHIDFGAALKLDGTQNKNATFGTEKYSSPEYHSGEPIDNEKFDVFALGIVFFNIHFRAHLFKKAKLPDENYRIIASGNFENFFNKFRGESNNIRDRFIFLDLVWQCLKKQHARSRLNEVISHEYFHQIRQQQGQPSQAVCSEIISILRMSK